jgi:phenylacetic acid degradation operon negative regulatory protein
MTKPLPAGKPTAKRLILSLLSAPSLEEVEVGHLVKWAELFDIEPTATRVAVGRLAKSGFITARKRGVYTIGPQGSLMARTASNWSLAEQRIRPWKGGWIIVHCSHLGRSNKTALRARERAFRLNGFAEMVSGLWCRPDNYTRPLTETREILLAIGLEPEAVMMQVSDIPGTQERELFGCWPREELEAGYHKAMENMATSTLRVGNLDIADAARETFLVGESVIRRINADPLLPEQMVDTAVRQRMIQAMMDYNTLGRSVWAEFQRTHAR